RAVPEGSSLRLFYDSGTTYNGHVFTDANSSELVLHSGVADLGSDPFRSRSSRARAGHDLILLEVRTPQSDSFCFQEPTDFNRAYWEGYRTAAAPAVFTMKLGDQIHNDCDL